ncbi:MAG: glycosyltransferase, partial [Burkholderiales bacterium]|nr:glycosyltransferase [Burkholderiales bacterium]
PGNSPVTFWRMLRLLRHLRPTIVHTRNLAAQEHQWVAAFAGVPCRIHSEHGLEGDGLSNRNWKHIVLRRAMQPWIHRYVALSRDLERFLIDVVHVPEDRITRICNGVDTGRFAPPVGSGVTLGPPGFVPPDGIIVGTVGRMAAVKDPLNLARGFAAALRMMPEARTQLRLVMIGDGEQREAVEALLTEAGIRDLAWLPGSRDGIPQLLGGMDIFCLPSISEGISNTILEAMASGLPVIATAVGGNPELVQDGATGTLVPPQDPEALAHAIVTYLRQPDVRREHGAAGRQRALEQFSIDAMVDAYDTLYSQLSDPSFVARVSASSSAGTINPGHNLRP